MKLKQKKKAEKTAVLIQNLSEQLYVIELKHDKQL